MGNSKDFSWCGEARRSGLLDSCGYQIGSLLPKPQPEPFLNKVARVAAVVLSQRLGVQNESARKQGELDVCPILATGECPLECGGTICRRRPKRGCKYLYMFPVEAGKRMMKVGTFYKGKYRSRRQIEGMMNREMRWLERSLGL